MNGVLLSDTPKLLPFPYPKFFFVFIYFMFFTPSTSKRISSDFELSNSEKTYRYKVYGEHHRNSREGSRFEANAGELTYTKVPICHHSLTIHTFHINIAC